LAASEANARPAPSLVEDVRASLERHLIAHGLGGAEANTIARTYTRSFQREYGGTTIYVPLVSSVDRAERNRQIVARFNGRNMHELGREHRITETAVRRILAKAQGKRGGQDS